MSLLGRSFTRGFGSYLGAFTAKALISSAASSGGGGWRARHFIGIVMYIASIVLSVKYSNEESALPSCMFLFGWLIPFLFYKIKDFIEFRKNRSYAKSEIIKLIENSKNSGVNISTEDEILKDLKNTDYPLLFLIEAKDKIERITYLYKKYGKDNIDVMNKILAGQYWFGMTEDHLKDMLPGQTPSSQERKEIKGKEVRKYVYGKNIYSGDTLVFTDGLLTEFKDKENFVNRNAGAEAVLN